MLVTSLLAYGMKFSVKLFQKSQFIVRNPTFKHPFPPLPTTSELIKLYKVRAAKCLAQNFLHDPKIIDRFIRCLTDRLDEYYACEVGPGPGSITRRILQMGVEHLTVIEKDKRFIPILQYVADVAEGHLSIVHGDILKYDVSSSFPSKLARSWHDDCPPFCVFGNLPFNISLPLLFQWLNLISNRDGLFKLGRIPFVLTFQSEIAERLISEPGGQQRSRLSLIAQYLCDVTYHFTLPGGSFIPPPKVDVGIVKLIPKKEFLIDLPLSSVDKVAKHILSGNKQKPVKFAIMSLLPPKRSDLLERMLCVSGVPPGIRPIMIDNLQFRDLCYAYEEICQEIPQLRLVDSYDAKVWKKYFDDDGRPLISMDTTIESDRSGEARNSLRHYLQSRQLDGRSNSHFCSRRELKQQNKFFDTINN